MVDIETRLRIAESTGHISPGQLRQFACACCRRISHLCDNPLFFEVLDFAERRAGGSYSPDELGALRARASVVYDSLYPGHGSPSAQALAYTAAGEAAFTEDPLKSAVTASSTAALALATKAAEDVDDAYYDAVFGSADKAESEAQAELLARFCSPS